MGGPGPICANCHDDKWKLSERGWCDTCESAPKIEFDPSGDGSYRVKCWECKRIVPSDQAHWIKADNLRGGANRCNDCGQAAHARYWSSNFRRRSSLASRSIPPRRGHGASEGDPSL